MKILLICESHANLGDLSIFITLATFCSYNGVFYIIIYNNSIKINL